MTTTNVRVRAQAFGGKFIGDKVEKAPMLTVLIDGKVVQDGLTIPNQDSGTVGTTQQKGTTSPYPIVVHPPPVPKYAAPDTYWLSPPAAGDSAVVVTLDLAYPTEVELRVTAFSPAPVTGSVKRYIVPGETTYTGQLGLPVPVQGLYVPSFSVTRRSGLDVVDVQATVAMLCGCPIGCAGGTPPAEAYWPSTEFEVVAFFIAVGFPFLFVPVPLVCQGTNQFGASPTIAGDVAWKVVLSALQPSTLNSGAAFAFLPSA